MPERRQSTKGNRTNSDRTARRRTETRRTESVSHRLTGADRTYWERYGNKLSATTRRAKWITSGDDHADRNGQSSATRSHEVIQRWAAERGGKPATIGSAR